MLQQLVSALEPNHPYTEKEINEFIKQYHDDYATIRREFIMHQYMIRDRENYTVNPQEMWPKWETLS